MSSSRKIRIAVDLSPLRAGGENGGAKILVETLLKELSQIETDQFEYLLISEIWNHDELLKFQTLNITCIAKSTIFGRESIHQSWRRRISATLGDLFSLLSNLDVQFEEKIEERTEILLKSQRGVYNQFSKGLVTGLKRLKARLKQKAFALRRKIIDQIDVELLSAYRLKILGKSSILRDRYEIDLLFCPFSDPALAEADLPLVAIAYDLQHLDLPFFFSEQERQHRTRFLRQLLTKADKVICISQFTEQSIAKYFEAEPEQLLSIPICIHERLNVHLQLVVQDYLIRFGLQTKSYFLFPANFWPHKNHKMLLLAYSIYRKICPDNALDLVFTGALDRPQKELKEIAHQLNCDSTVHFLGFLREDELVAVWQGCSGLIFPSLYEGFGIPLLEAMWFGKPIACSSVGSLPEVGGDAVIYFDPRQPEAIAQAMIQLTHNNDLIGQLKVQSQQRLQLFSQRRMAEDYLSVFKSAITAN